MMLSFILGYLTLTNITRRPVRLRLIRVNKPPDSYQQRRQGIESLTDLCQFLHLACFNTLQHPKHRPKCINLPRGTDKRTITNLSSNDDVAPRGLH
jgi:hypothetical protein